VVSSSLPYAETNYQAIQPKLVFGQPELTTSRKMLCGTAGEQNIFTCQPSTHSTTD